jgi:hypothetical protein
LRYRKFKRTVDFNDFVFFSPTATENSSQHLKIFDKKADDCCLSFFGFVVGCFRARNQDIVKKSMAIFRLHRSKAVTRVSVCHAEERGRLMPAPLFKWLKRFGVAGFLFFLIKGLLWLIVPFLVGYSFLNGK